ncbi:phospholipase A(1) DAD1, chloroplastic [Cicer arietinum]|uniref:Phospholipase A(1) DAD1, chloroplastic n=1 Tax=Cicer arietinum TaxID=3827 RepID=A0A1S2XQG7_CICAR|nr:phospholipase A(1) DAD1, chloroplastic [Cicer arietinum]
MTPLNHPTTFTPFSTTKTFTIKPQCITLIQPTKPNTKQHSHDTLKRTEKTTNLSTSSRSTTTPIPLSTKVSKRWKEYQGMRNWEGLLDPLDNNLRSEILRYGHFVEAAYKSFEFEPSSPNYSKNKFPKTTLLKKCGLPKTGYKLTKHLHATSGIQLPSWFDKAPTWVATKTSYIGYVAVCDNKEEIKRLGRRDVVIAFRGTTTCLEWLDNLRATLTNIDINIPCNNNNNKNNNNEPMVESGFLSLYTSKQDSSSSINAIPSLQEMVRKEIGRILKTYEGENLSFTITGHSLGAALAILTAYDIKTSFNNRKPLVTVMSFGGPRVGNRRFRLEVEKEGIKVLRIVNSDDVITKMPGFVFDEDDVEGNGDEVEGDVAWVLPRWIQKRVEETQLVYSEVGEELRLCSKDSPYLRGFNVATCHDLKTYLHLVDGFVSSSCPFRSTANRFLHR